ncbi:outer membrane lipoprotein chaperone LolA [Colwellia piezophila]|uniref:outer membrane lipoprotein chaperone LolA n=1 Tax=Colwellia piezophila TaxID=211668 RepID=UPI000373E3A3|nr:outer membrane lipoprotein chaperone LolA [Colwellia piezophila]
MQINFTSQPFFRTILFTSAFTTALVPVMGLAQSTDFAPQATYAAPTTLKGTARQSSEAKKLLMAKLRQLAFFSADFTQKILNEEGELLQEGSGKMAITKPNLVHWQTITPDETLIVSDGSTLWFYDPFIEQASAYSLAKSIHNTPILLLTSDEPSLWQQYDVVQEDVASEVARFIVTPKDKNSQIKQLIMSFTRSHEPNADAKNNQKPQLTEFSFQDATGQVSQISLSHFNSTVRPDASLFKFILPQGVRLEDQR